MYANCLAGFFLVLSILGPCSPTPTPTNNILNSDKNGVHPLESVQLTPVQVKSLCNAVAQSHIDNGQLYQWIKVQKQQQQQQPEETELKKHVQCLKIGFTPCLGETRFPLTMDCGVINLFPANDEECSSSSSRSKRSSSTDSESVSVSLSHGQAHHLCHQNNFQVPPKSLDEIDYVAVKIVAYDEYTKNGTAQKVHPSEECVVWTYKPCESENEADCDIWTKVVKPGKKCAIFYSEDPADHSQRSKLHHELSSSSLPEMKRIISCRVTDSHSGIKCQILPQGTEISTEDQNEESHSRQKRWLSRCVRKECCCRRGICNCCCRDGRHYPGRGYGDRCSFWCVICPKELCGG